jgi:hypothetical protein
MSNTSVVSYLSLMTKFPLNALNAFQPIAVSTLNLSGYATLFTRQAHAHAPPKQTLLVHMENTARNLHLQTVDEERTVAVQSHIV